MVSVVLTVTLHATSEYWYSQL